MATSIFPAPQSVWVTPIDGGPRLRPHFCLRIITALGSVRLSPQFILGHSGGQRATRYFCIISPALLVNDSQYRCLASCMEIAPWGRPDLAMAMVYNKGRVHFPPARRRSPRLLFVGPIAEGGGGPVAPFSPHRRPHWRGQKKTCLAVGVMLSY